MKMKLEKGKKKEENGREKYQELERSEKEGNEHGKRKKNEMQKNRTPPAPANSFVCMFRLACGAIVILFPFELKQNKF